MLYALILLGIAMNALEITNPFVKKREIPSVYDSLLRVNNIDCSLYSYLKGKRHSKNTYGYFYKPKTEEFILKKYRQDLINAEKEFAVSELTFYEYLKLYNGPYDNIHLELKIRSKRKENHQSIRNQYLAYRYTMKEFKQIKDRLRYIKHHKDKDSLPYSLCGLYYKHKSPSKLIGLESYLDNFVTNHTFKFSQLLLSSVKAVSAIGNYFKEQAEYDEL